ncbi:hypothetical protein QR680_016624 [Steinernema hermaphroditum]|uniref:Prostaglandin E synthase 2 n=1 Tax=Steinernema hermaphroditum TaxID=289476 RepID=A0AA39HBT9_9BILA|nr:hypothetical protein QR680_016624 [Steinernema hermaphroditum]
MRIGGSIGRIGMARILGAAGGVGLASVLLMNKETKAEQKPWKIEHATQSAKDDVMLSRKIVNELDKTGLNLRLYQYQTCPFCCKVRAFLDYYGFSYEVVEVNPVTRSQIKFANGYKKVPIMTSCCCDQPLVESSLIVSVLATYLQLPKRSLNECMDFYPSIETVDENTQKPAKSFPNKYFVMEEEKTLTQDQIQSAREEREWRDWVDSHFIHLISPNVYRTWSESLSTFQWFSVVGDWERNFPLWERYLAVYMGALAMFAISKSLKKRHNIEDERKVLFEACDKWVAAIGKNRRFMGGDEPNLADLALFGAVNSFVGCAAFKEMREKTAIGPWFDAVKAAVEERQGSKYLAVRAKKD